MNIQIHNQVPGVKVSVNQNPDGSFAILLVEETKKNTNTLGKMAPGSIVKLGGREYIVLGHGAETTAVITKDIVCQKTFGNTGDYPTSTVRKWLNTDFYAELCKAVGKENIVEHTVKLMCDDGTNKGKSCKDNVSLITTDNYRRYRAYLPKIGKSFWTATQVTTDDADYTRRVCCVSSCGVLNWGGCVFSSGVRPFCILSSDILVS